ncbi:unnamed protein product [Caenorhabditis nigoni]
MNALVFAVYNHLNEMDNFLIFSKNDHVYTDDRGRIVSPEIPTAVDGNGKYITSNGGMDLATLTILNNISAMVGCVVSVLIARWSFHKSIITFTILIVASFLLSQAFLFNFLDRIAFVIGSILSKSLSIIAIQAAFESAQEKYRVYAIGLAYYLSNGFVFVTLLLFKKDSDLAETQYMFIITLIISVYALACPWQLVHCIVRRDIEKVKWILNKFAQNESPPCDALVDDILYVNRVPQNAIESIAHLIKIRPFLRKMIALTVLLSLQSRLNSGEMEMIKTMLPYSPMESILFSKISSCLASVLAVFFVLKLGRRRFLLLLLFLNLFISYTISLVPIDSFSVCFSRDMPSEDHAIVLIVSFIAMTVVRVASTITILLITLEHIPSIHRSFVFPIVMLCDAIMSSMSDAAPYMANDLHDYPPFIGPMLRYSMISLLIAAYFIDNSDVSVFTTNEIRCYNLKNEEKEDKDEPIVTEFEERFRTLCEVKAIEKDTFIKQELDKEGAYENECVKYHGKRSTKLEMKEKLRDSSCDEKTKRNYAIRYFHRKEINRKCVEASREKLRRRDKKTQAIVHRIQKSRMKV